MRRFGNDTEAHGTAGESTFSSIGALIKVLLEKFSNLHSGCMYQIECLAPEILHRVVLPLNVKLELSKTSNQPGLSEAERKKLLARERQAAVMAKMKAAQEKFFASCQASQEQGELDRGRSPSKTPEDSCLSQREQCSQIPSAVMCALCRDSCFNSTISFVTFVQRSKLLEIAAKGVPSWQKRDQSKCVEALNFNEGTDTDLSVGDSDVHESQIRVELLNLIQMALNGDVDREGPIEVEALLAFLGDEGFTESVDGSQSSVETRMAETTSSDSGSDDSEEEEGIMVRNDPPNTFLDCSGLALAKGGAAAEFEDETAKIRQHFLITVLLEYANLLSKNRKDQQQPESENSASLQKHSFSRLSQRNAAGESPHHHVGSNDLLGTHVSSCGHAVHQECLDRYRSSLLQRYQSRTLFEGLQIVDPNQREFLCPVCRRLANSVLPYITEATVPGGAGGRASCILCKFTAFSLDIFFIFGFVGVSCNEPPSKC
ncbi:hypothetical protein L7F22_012836 [Adiantum nelumboides]|nr:hypothetical protein [Adiantum nelumboides]